MVIHLITRLPTGGATQLVYDIAKRIHDSGGPVLILTGLSDATSLSAPNNRVLDQVRAAGIPVEVCPYLVHRISPLKDLRALLWLCRKLRPHRDAVVHIHSSKAGLLGRVACRIAGVRRVIFHVHGWAHSRSQGIARTLMILLERCLYYLTPAYIFVCREDLVEFVRVGGNPGIAAKGTVIYPGTEFLDEDQRRQHRREMRAELGFSDADFVIGTVGRLDYQKNPQAFIPIAKAYGAIDSSARFLWVGDGQHRDEVQSLIDQAGLATRFRLAGYVPDAEPYFTVFDTFVLSSRYEGLPLSVVKALSVATPVVGFLVNGMKDLYDRFESVFGVSPGDSAGFVNNLAAARAMGEAGRDKLEREALIVRETMNGDRMFQAIAELYSSMRGEEGGLVEQETLPALPSV